MMHGGLEMLIPLPNAVVLDKTVLGIFGASGAPVAPVLHDLGSFTVIANAAPAAQFQEA